eukprot:2268946-Pyramimonas_sp.AAC.1
MCGVGPDTLLHRLRLRQHCDEQRREVLGDKGAGFIDDADSTEDPLLFTRGLFQHPGDAAPLPCSDGGVIFVPAPGGLLKR